MKTITKTVSELIETKESPIHFMPNNDKERRKSGRCKNRLIIGRKNSEYLKIGK